MTATQDDLYALALGTRDLRDVVSQVVDERTWSAVLAKEPPNGGEQLLMTEELERVLTRNRLVVVRIDDAPEYDDYDLEGEE